MNFFRRNTSSNLFDGNQFDDFVIEKMYGLVKSGQVPIEELDGAYEELIGKDKTEFVDTLVKNLLRTARGMRRNRRKIRRGFERRLAKRWRKPLELYEVVLEGSKEIGDNYNRHYGRESTESNDLVFHAESHLHGRCCQIGYEVLALLRAGCADGAHARWRSMHELVVVAMFISEHGQNVAERYLLHDVVESCKVSRQAFALGDSSITQDEVIQLESEVSSLCKRFGSDYKSQYGWAADALGKTRPFFVDIEKSLGMEQFRPSYKLASHNVHANPKGITFRLGNPSRDLILAGPSNAGLSEAGISASWSLFQITYALLSGKMTYTGMLCVESLRVLAEKTARAFLEVEERVQKLAEEETD